MRIDSKMRKGPCVQTRAATSHTSLLWNDSMSKLHSKPYGDDTEAVLEARKYTQSKGLPDPYRAYMLQRKGAMIRNIEWGFTFAAWWAIWRICEAEGQMACVWPEKKTREAMLRAMSTSPRTLETCRTTTSAVKRQQRQESWRKKRKRRLSPDPAANHSAESQT